VGRGRGGDGTCWRVADGGGFEGGGVREQSRGGAAVDGLGGGAQEVEGRQWIWKRSRGGGGWTLEAAELLKVRR
jgi:hypothetical protein